MDGLRRIFLAGSESSRPSNIRVKGLDLFKALESGILVSGCLVGSNVGDGSPGALWNRLGRPGIIIPGGKKCGIPGGINNPGWEVMALNPEAIEHGTLNGGRKRLANGDGKPPKNGDTGDVGSDDSVDGKPGDRLGEGELLVLKASLGGVEERFMTKLTGPSLEDVPDKWDGGGELGVWLRGESAEVGFDPGSLLHSRSMLARPREALANSVGLDTCLFRWASNLSISVNPYK